MTSSSKTEGTDLEPLQRITDRIYLFEPEPQPDSEPELEPFDQSSTTTIKTTSKTSPSLIILCAWAGATSRGCKKYISGHRLLWPRAAILLIKTPPLDFAVVPRRRIWCNLAKAREAIHKHVNERTSEKHGPRILLHIMSNAGLYMTMNLIQSLQSSLDKGRAPLNLSPHIRAIIFDCTPGRTEFWRTFKAAIATGNPKSWLPTQMVFGTFAALAIGFLITGQQSGLLSGAVDVARRHANDPDQLSSSNRLYLYSKADEMIGYRDVESHMEDAKTRAGLTVESVKFTDALHCALVAHDAKRYWDAIQGFWERAGKNDLTERPARLRSRL